MREKHLIAVTRLMAALLVSFAFLTGFAQQVCAQGATQAPGEEVILFDEIVEPNILMAELDYLLVPLTEAELAKAAAIWQEILRERLVNAARLNLQISNASGANLAELRKTLLSQTQDLAEMHPKYSAILDSWERKGADPEQLEKHKTYLAAVIEDSFRTSDFVTQLRDWSGWLVSRDGGGSLLWRIVVLLLAVWAMFFVSRIVSVWAVRGLRKLPSVSKLLLSFVQVVMYWLTFFVGAMLVLAMVGVNVTPLFALLGGMSFILGFALQEVLGNLASGLMLMIMKPFDMGDYIQAAGTSGTVEDMSVVSTKIRTFDNQIITVPNSMIWGDVITNVDASETRRVDLIFGIAYSDDPNEAIEGLKQLVKEDERCLSDPEPEIFVAELGESSVNIFCRPWVKTPDYWDVYWSLTARTKELFDTKGISIPFPQRDVHIISSSFKDEV